MMGLWMAQSLILRSEAELRVSKDAQEGCARSARAGGVLRGRSAAPQDEAGGGAVRPETSCASLFAQAVVGRISSLRRRARKANAP